MDRSLYLDYRPQTFSELLEQEHVSRTLTNAIETDRLAHAYLFCGPRGTGKTTTARILAKALNCEKGPTPEPCGTCDKCTRIRDGYTMDVVELDAASNRGIDEIRRLRENVQYAPAEGAFKFYIVDEAHQITRDAFNALLKTLEEPPAHVIFVLATTEPDRLPATILSRCQRFDFKRIGNEVLVEHLTRVARKEGVEIEEAAARAIARSAEGAVRDGLTVLEQMLSFSEGTITYEEVIAALGYTETELLTQVSEAVIGGDPAKIVEVVDGLVEAGKDLHQLLKDLASHFRDLLVLSLGAESAELKALSPEVREAMQAQAKDLGRTRGVGIIDTLSQAQGELRWNPQHRLVVELALLKAAESVPVAAPAPAARPQAAPARRAAPPRRPAPPPAPAFAPQRQAKPSGSSKPEPAKRAPDQEAAPKPAVRSAPALLVDADVAPIAERWPEALAAVKQKSVPVHALLVDSVPVAVGDGVLVLGFHHQFHRDHCAESANKALVESVIAKVFGPFSIDCQMGTEWTGGNNTAVAEASPTSNPPADDEPDPEGFIRQAIDMFDGTIVDQNSS